MIETLSNTPHKLTVEEIGGAISGRAGVVARKLTEFMMRLGGDRNAAALFEMPTAQLSELLAIIITIRKHFAIMEGTLRTILSARKLADGLQAPAEAQTSTPTETPVQTPGTVNGRNGTGGHELVNGDLQLREITVPIIVNAKTGELVFVGDPKDAKDFKPLEHEHKAVRGGDFVRLAKDFDWSEVNRNRDLALVELLKQHGRGPNGRDISNAEITVEQVRAAKAWASGKLAEKKR